MCELRQDVVIIFGDCMNGLVVRVITKEVDGVRIVEAQIRPSAIMRLALVKTEPELGVEAVRTLPSILRDERVRRELGLPEFDDVVLRPRTHSPTESDLELRLRGRTVGEFSVKFAVRGNISYAINAWKRELRGLDLILLVPLRGVRGEESIYYIGVFWIDASLRAQPTQAIVDVIYRMLSEKMREEKLENIWPVDIREVALALRDYRIMRTLERVEESLTRVVERLDRIVELLRELLRRQRSS